MKLTNKTIGLKVRGNIDGALQVVDNVMTVTLPDIETLKDTIKGAGILGEVDIVSTGQVGPLVAKIDFRSISKNVMSISAPTSQSIEVSWAQDTFDTATGATRVIGCKAFLTGVPNKVAGSKIEVNAGQDVSIEMGLSAYRLIIDGEEVINIDKLNYVYSVNGTDYAKDIRNAL